MPNHDLLNSKNLDIRTSAGIELPPQIKSVLQAMFPNFQRIAVEAKLDGGFSGSYVYRVRLIEANLSDELAIVKIAPVSLIEQEQQAYEKWVKLKLPNTTRVDVSSALSEDRLWKGLRYTIAGGGVFQVKSLYDYYQIADIEDIAHVIRQRLFEVLGQRWWWNSWTEPSFQMQTDYDDLLPLNLIIKQVKSSDQIEPNVITAGDITSLPVISDGAWVQLNRFAVTKVNPSDNEITLNI
ncbi:MAG TPA: hypothetical protein P5526_30135 [Anaerolineae bacterium]|nr:hypothetical protein [Anaerolineae bacterium]